MIKDIEFASLDGVTIRGSLLRAEPARAVCLFLHGITTSRDEHLDFHLKLAQHAFSKGVSSLLIDFRAHGKSEGRQIDFSPIGQCLDASAAISFLKRTHDFNAIPLVIFGTSFGAMPAIMCALRFEETVHHLVLFAPVVDYVKTFLKPTTEWAKQSFTPEAICAVEDKGFLLLDENFEIGARLIYEMRTIDPTVEAKKVAQPIVLVHGALDSMVPISLVDRPNERHTR